MSEKARLKDETKKAIRALLISEVSGLTVRQLENDYRSMIGQQLPYRTIGYTTMEELIRDIPDVCSIDWRGGQLFLRGIADESTQHIQRMVARQKVAPNKSRRPARQINYRAPPIKRNVPAYIQVQIKQLLEDFPKGLHSADFNNAYSRKFKQNILSSRIGFSTLTDVLFALPNSLLEIQKLSAGGFMLHLSDAQKTPNKIRSCSSSPGSVSQPTSPREVTSSSYIKPDTQHPSGVEFTEFDDLGVHRILKDEIRQILQIRPSGVWASRLCIEYQKRFSKQLSFLELGFSSVIELCSALPDVITIERPNPKGDWMLYDVDKKKTNTSKPAKKQFSVDEKNYLSTAPNVDDVFLETLQQVLATRDGVLVSDLQELYLRLVGKELNYYSMGFASLEALLLAQSNNIVIKYAGNVPGRTLLYTKGEHGTDLLMGLHRDTMEITTGNSLQPTKRVPADAVGPGACYKKLKLPENLDTFFKVYVSHIEDPGCFYLQLKGSHTTEALEYIMDLLEDVYYGYDGDKYEMPDFMVTIGQVGVATFAEDGNWHRIVISGIKDENFVEVFYVDYGTTGCVPRSGIRMLRTRLMQLPAQAVKSRLANIKSTMKEGWTKSAKQLLLKLCSNKLMLALVTSVTENYLSVCLCDTSGENDIHINDTLIAERHGFLYPDNIEEQLAAQNTELQVNRVVSLEPEELHYKKPTFSIETKETSNHGNTSSQLVNPQNRPSDIPVMSDEESSESSEEVLVPRKVCPIRISSGCIVHIVMWEREAYMTSGDISQLIWDGDYLRSRMRLMKMTPPTNLVISVDYNQDLFDELKRNNVVGLVIRDTLRSHLTIYKLQGVPPILETFGCKDPKMVNIIQHHLDSFDPDDPYWEGVDASDDEASDEEDDDVQMTLEDLETTLQALQFKRKRIIHNMMHENYEESVDELQAVELQIQRFKNRISAKAKNNQAIKKRNEEDEFVLDCVDKQYQDTHISVKVVPLSKQEKTLAKTVEKKTAQSPVTQRVEPTVIETKTSQPQASTRSSSSRLPQNHAALVVADTHAVVPQSTVLQPQLVVPQSPGLVMTQRMMTREEQQVLYQQMTSMATPQIAFYHQMAALSLTTQNPLSITSQNPLSMTTQNPLSMTSQNPLSMPTQNPWNMNPYWVNTFQPGPTNLVNPNLLQGQGNLGPGLPLGRGRGGPLNYIYGNMPGPKNFLG